MARLILLITLFLGLQCYSEASECKQFCNDNFGYLENSEVATSCEKGCIYHEISNEEENCGNRKGCCENACSLRFRTNGILSQSCFRGCMFTQTPQEAAAEEEPEGVLGQLFMIVRKFYYDPSTGKGITLTQVYKFGGSEESSAPANEEQELKSPEQLLESALSSRDDSSLPSSSSHSTSLISSYSSVDYSALFDFLLLLSMAAFSLLGLVYILVMIRGRRAALANQKAANLAVAVQHEPIKLVRPEDLTKLSLIDDDEAPPLPEKGDLGLPRSTV